MKKRNMLLLTLLISTVFACNPKTESPTNTHQYGKNTPSVHEVQHNEENMTSTNSLINRASQSEKKGYEQYIQQWPNKRGVTIDLNINEINTNDNLWMIEARKVVKGLGISRPMYMSHRFVAGTVKFNSLQNLLEGINIAIPLIVPIKEHDKDLLPNDPAVIYNNGINSRQVDISYEYILKQMLKLEDVSTYFNEELSKKSGDLVIYIYRLDSTYEHYKKAVIDHMYDQHSFTAPVKDVIELVRISV